MSVHVFSHTEIKPFWWLGLTGNFWTVHIDILMSTWVAIFVLLVFAIIGRLYLNKERSMLSFMYERLIATFMDLCTSSFKSFNYKYFAFIVSIFLFTFFSSLVGLIPFVKEATEDINTTLAISLTSFLYIQYHKIRVHGLIGFLKEFIEPFFPLAPIHIVGEISKIASMSFRLFGNILGGSIILGMIIGSLNAHKEKFLIFMVVVILFAIILRLLFGSKKIPVVSSVSTFLCNVLFMVTWVQMLLGIFEGLIQAFVLTMLTTTYLAIGTQEHQELVEHKEIA